MRLKTKERLVWIRCWRTRTLIGVSDSVLNSVKNEI